MDNRVGAKYVGGGHFLIGVPARDLTTADLAIHQEAIRQAQRETGVVLYDLAESAPEPGRKGKTE
jgi:hypothetical protein